jgi:palmitoyltransferase
MSSLSHLSVPFVCALIFFLGYPSQWLLMRLDPGPLTKNQLVTANVVLVLIWITYARSVLVDPGTIPRDWAETEVGKGGRKSVGEEGRGKEEGEGEGEVKSRKWCRKCDAPKPPRAHHCKECKRYVCSQKKSVQIIPNLLRRVFPRAGWFPLTTCTNTN